MFNLTSVTNETVSLHNVTCTTNDGSLILRRLFGTLQNSKNYLHCSHSAPSVPTWVHSSKPAAASLLLLARRAGDTD